MWVPPFVAHTPNEAGEWHDLVEHSLGTAERAKRFATSFGGHEAAEWIGLAHDVGKFGRGFQDYMLRCEQAVRTGTEPPKRGPDHSSAGAVLATLFGDYDLAALIAGHHGQIPARFNLGARILAKVTEVRESLQQGEKFLPSVFRRKKKNLLPQDIANGTARQKELFLRFLFSTLVDADYLDTEAHFDRHRSELRSSVPRDVSG